MSEDTPVQKPRGSRGMGFFSILWLGYFISSLGTGLIGFALGVTVYQDTGSVSRYTLIGLSSLLPNLLLSPLAGALADRFSRRHILILSGIGGALTNGLMYLVVQHEPVDFWKVYPVVLLAGSFSAFVWPTFTAVTTLIVDKRDLGRASGLTQVGSSVSSIIAPTLSALLLLAIGLKGIVLLNLVSYLVPVAILLLVRLPDPVRSEEGKKADQGPPMERALYGWRFIRERQGLLLLLLMFAAFNFFMSMVHILLTPLVLSFASPLALGLVLTLGASGTLVGGIVTAVWGGPKRNRIRTILLVLAFCGLLLLLIGWRADILLIASGGFFFVLGYPVMGACSQVIWQSKVPTDLQGRVFAMRRMLAGSTMPLALILAGPLADNVLEPLMAPGGALAETFLGDLIGVGPGRGIGLLYLMLALAIWFVVAICLRSKALMQLENELPDALEDAPEGLGRRPREMDGGLSKLPAAASWLLLLAVAGATAASIGWLRPPPAVGKDAPAEAFSSARAFPILEAVASEPHAPGSEAHRRVRIYLEDHMRDLGLEVEVQRELVRTRLKSLAQLVTVENVLARWPGKNSQLDAVLLVAHYDSVPTSPGAGDNGSAVAALAETARALTAGSPLERDVIFLFSDAEELNLAGARAFVERHPWAPKVGVVLNFDARGHAGPVYLFQTGQDHGGWLPEFLSANPPKLYTSSLLNQIYQELPYGTDFDVFHEAGFAGFNFAYIDGLNHYHTGLDLPADVDPDSVQHQGELALGLARHFANLETLPEGGPNHVYFNLFGNAKVRYPHGMAYVSAVLVVVLFFAVAILGLRRGKLSPFGLAQGFLACLGNLIAVPVAITLIWMLGQDAFDVPVMMNSTDGDEHFMGAFALLAAALYLVVFDFYRRFIAVLDLTMGTLLAWGILVVLTTDVWQPVETNFIAVWPALWGLLTVAAVVLWPKEGSRWPLAVVLLLTAILPIALLAPFIASVYLGMQSLTALGGGPLILEVLLLGILMPHLEVIRRPLGKVVPISLTLLGLGWFAVAVSVSRGLEMRQSSVFYAQDLDTDEAHWFSVALRPDPWTQQFGFRQGILRPLDRFYPPAGRPFLHSEAPMISGMEPEVAVTRVASDGRIREVSVRFEPTPKGISRLLFFDPPNAVLSAKVDDVATSLLDGEEGRPLLHRVPLPMQTEEIELRVLDEGPVTMTVIQLIEGLPPLPDLEPRPANRLRRPYNLVLWSDQTLIRRSYSLDLPSPSSMAEEKTMAESESAESESL